MTSSRGDALHIESAVRLGDEWPLSSTRKHLRKCNHLWHQCPEYYANTESNCAHDQRIGKVVKIAALWQPQMH